MKELDHPNICRLFEYFEDEKHMFFVLELCAGGELFDVITEEKVISEQTSARILDQVIRALRYAHERKVAHRDLKPENVCFSSRDRTDPSIKVIDWGLSTTFRDETMTSAVGTFLYSAPEVLSQAKTLREERQPYTCMCDIWSLGVLAYVMLCGRPPFWGSKRAMMDKILTADFPMNFHPWVPDNNGKAGLSSVAQDFVRQLLQVDPSKRLTAEQAGAHPWIEAASKATVISPHASTEVMTNLLHFSRQSLFRSICIAIIAQQLDHSHLADLASMFRQFDTSGDGVLQMDEVKEGFKKLLGGSCPNVAKIEELFRAMDLDGSGTIDYTEFCAAGLGQRERMREDALWAAFRSLDRRACSGKLTIDDLTSVLVDTDMERHLSVQTCGEVARKLVHRWDVDSNGCLDFDEFRALMLGNTSGVVLEEEGLVDPPYRNRSRSKSKIRDDRVRGRSRSPRGDMRQQGKRSAENISSEGALTG